jgi:hypothetical protein
MVTPGSAAISRELTCSNPRVVKAKIGVILRRVNEELQESVKILV